MLYNHFRNDPSWEDIKLWQGLLKASYNKKSTEEQARAKFYSDDDATGVNKILSFGMKMFTQKPKLGMDRDILTSVLHELTYYMGRLTRNLIICSDILVHLAIEYRFSIIDVIFQKWI